MVKFAFLAGLAGQLDDCRGDDREQHDEQYERCQGSGFHSTYSMAPAPIHYRNIPGRMVTETTTSPRLSVARPEAAGGDDAIERQRDARIENISAT